MLVVDRINSSEIDVVLLNDTGIQGIEVHDQDELIPKATLWFEDQTTLVLVSFRFRRFSVPVGVLVLGFLLGFALLPPRFVGTYVLEPVELVQQDVLITFGASTVQSLVPAGGVRERRS